MLVLAHSIQVFEFNTSKSATTIKTILEERKKSQNTDYPQIIEVKESNGIVNFSMKIWKGDEILFYEISLKPKDNFLIVKGRGDGRGNINRYLADLIENDTQYNVVSEYQLTVKQMLSLFDNIVSENNRNIITHLKVLFEPTRGFQYDKETYTELSYKFIENRCASKHRDFKTLCKNGKRMYMSLGIMQCTGIVNEAQNVSTRIDITPNCSFRMYSSIPSKDWDDFCFKLLNFL